MREGVIAYDMERRLTFVNPAFERLTGYPTEDLREQEFLQYIHDEDRPAILAEWDRLAQGGALRDQEYRVITRSGQTRWCSSSWEPMRDEGGRQIGYMGTEFDITERKLAEEAMRLDTELFQAVLEVEQAVSAAGLDSDTVMRVIAERSKGLTGASGAVIEAIEGEDVVPLVHVGTEAPRLKMSASLSGLCVRTGELQRCDDTQSDPRVPHQAYSELGIRSILVVPLKDEHRTLGVLKVVSPEAHAFTERDAKALRLLGGLMGAALGHAAAFEGRQTRLEERTRALQESEQRFKQLVDVAQEGIWVADDRGVITYVNQRLADLLGYGNGTLLGPAGLRLHRGRVPAGRPAHPEPPRCPPGQSQDLRFRRRDGTQLWGLVSSSPILGKDGALVGTVGMVTDITERKRTEEQLRRSADRLAMLHDMDQAILAAQSPAEVGRAALGRMRRMVPCQRCTRGAVRLRARPGRADRRLFAAESSWPPPHRRWRSFRPPRCSSGARSATSRTWPQMKDSPPMLRQLQAEGLRSLLSVAAAGGGGGDRRDQSRRVHPGGVRCPSTGTSRSRSPLRWPSPFSTPGFGRSSLARPVSWSGGWRSESSALRAATAEVETLLYSVSHDLRAPLRHLIGFSRMLLDDHGKDLDPGALHYAERIHQAADQMATLVDDLVGLSRIGRQDLLRREVGLTTLVEDVVDQLRSSSDGRVIEWQVEELPTVECDPGLAKIAITHLLANAVKFTRSAPAGHDSDPSGGGRRTGWPRRRGQRRGVQDDLCRQAVRHVPAAAPSR